MRFLGPFDQLQQDEALSEGHRGKITFLRLNAKRVLEIRGMKGELLRAIVERSAGEKETKRVQDPLARKAVLEVIDDK